MYLSVCMYVYICIRDRGREGERERESLQQPQNPELLNLGIASFVAPRLDSRFQGLQDVSERLGDAGNPLETRRWKTGGSAVVILPSSEGC